MQKVFDMTMIGKLIIFLGFQIKQTNDKIFIHQSKNVKELLKRSKLDEVKPMSTYTSYNMTRFG